MFGMVYGGEVEDEEGGGGGGRGRGRGKAPMFKFPRDYKFPAPALVSYKGNMPLRDPRASRALDPRALRVMPLFALPPDQVVIPENDAEHMLM